MQAGCLPKDGLPSDMTRRRPVDGEGDSRRWRGRCGGGPGVTVASPDAGEDVVAVAPIAVTTGIITKVSATSVHWWWL